MAEETTLNPPCEFGRFLVERELGSGGMGGVYLARDKMLDRACALKVMLKSYGADAVFVERFKKEAQAAARLIHPNIAQIYAYDILDGQPFIAMEMVGAGSLAKLMEVHKGTLDPHRVMRIGKQIAEGLSCAADQGLVHGDVKPENILLDTAGTAKLVDFGLAAMQHDTEDIWGTPYYVAPEKVKREEVDFRADMFSLAATLYHALTGEAPFEGADAAAVVRARLEGAPRKPSEVRKDLPAALDAIILKALALDPNDRYATYEGFVGDINRFLAGEAVSAAPAAKAEAETKSASAATHGGKKVMMLKKKKVMIKKKVAGHHEEDETSEEGETPEEGDVPELSEDGEGEETSGKKGKKKSKFKKRALVEDDEDGEKEGMGAGKMVVLAIVGVIVAILLLVGGLLWYLHSSDVTERTERANGYSKMQEEAHKAIKTTIATAQDFAANLNEMVQAAEKTVRKTSDEYLRMLDEAERTLVKDILVPPSSKELDAAIAYTNQVIQARLQLAAQAAAQAAAAAAAAQPAPTNAPAAVPAAAPAGGAATNAAAATAAPTNAPAATAAPAAAPAKPEPGMPDLNHPPAFKDEAGEVIDKASPEYEEALKKWREETKKKIAELKAKKDAKPAAKAEEKKEDDAAEGEKADGEKQETKIPESFKAFQQLWFDLYICRAARIRVQVMLEDVEKVSDAALGVKPPIGLDDAVLEEQRQAAEKLAKLSNEAVELYGKMKDQKIVYEAQKKAGVIKAKAPSLLKTTQLQIKRAKARAEKIAKDKAEEEARIARKKAADEAHKKLAVEEIEKARQRYEGVRSLVKHLAWDLADKNLAALENDLKTIEGKMALKDERRKVSMMRAAHKLIIKNAKNFEFKDHTKVVQADEKKITVQHPERRVRDGKGKNAKMKAERPKPVTQDWDRYFAKNAKYFNWLVIGIVERGLEARKVTSKLEWSNAMLGSALIMQALFPEDPNVSKRVKKIVRSAVKGFDGCRKYAEKFFPDVNLDEEEEEAGAKKDEAKKDEAEDKDGASDAKKDDAKKDDAEAKEDAAEDEKADAKPSKANAKAKKAGKGAKKKTAVSDDEE